VEVCRRDTFRVQDKTRQDKRDKRQKLTVSWCVGPSFAYESRPPTTTTINPPTSILTAIRPPFHTVSLVMANEGLLIFKGNEPIMKKVFPSFRLPAFPFQHIAKRLRLRRRQRSENDNDEDEDSLILIFSTHVFLRSSAHVSILRNLLIRYNEIPIRSFFIRTVTTWTKTMPSLGPPFVEWLSPRF
jgi:hypothetical protein